MVWLSNIFYDISKKKKLFFFEPVKNRSLSKFTAFRHNIFLSCWSWQLFNFVMTYQGDSAAKTPTYWFTTVYLPAGVYNLVRKCYLSPLSENDVLPLSQHVFFYSYQALFALILPYFAIILPFYFLFSLFLSPFFLLLCPFFLFLLYFPPFTFSLFVFFP
jgi:hypothetical protein